MDDRPWPMATSDHDRTRLTGRLQGSVIWPRPAKRRYARREGGIGFGCPRTVAIPARWASRTDSGPSARFTRDNARTTGIRQARAGIARVRCDEVSPRPLATPSVRCTRCRPVVPRPSFRAAADTRSRPGGSRPGPSPGRRAGCSRVGRSTGGCGPLAGRVGARCPRRLGSAPCRVASQGSVHIAAARAYGPARPGNNGAFVPSPVWVR